MDRQGVAVRPEPPTQAPRAPVALQRHETTDAAAATHTDRVQVHEKLVAGQRPS